MLGKTRRLGINTQKRKKSCNLNAKIYNENVKTTKGSRTYNPMSKPGRWRDERMGERDSTT